MLRPGAIDDAVSPRGWQDVERRLDDLARRALVCPPPADFYAGLVQELMSTAAGLGGVVWTLGPGGAWRVVATCGAADKLLHDAALSEVHRAGLWGAAAGVGATAWTVPAAVAAQTLSWSARFGDGERDTGCLEVWLPQDADPEEGDRAAALLSAFAEIASDYVLRSQLGQLREVLGRWDGWNEAVERIHAPTDREAIASAIANEVCRLSGSDRVTVLERIPGRGSAACYAVTAISGVSHVDRRAAAVRALEGVATELAYAGQPVWYPEREASTAWSSVWDEYADQYPVRAVGAIPLPARSGGVRAGASDSPLGMLFCERFAEREYGPAERRVLEQLARQAAVAWNRVDEMEQWPLATLSRWLRAGGWVHGTRVRWTSALLIPIVAAVAGVILLAPADFDVRAEGTLQPMERREVYAPAAGVVQEIHVRGGQQVAAGDVLVTLRSAELESELARLAGELQTARRQYQSVQAARRQAVLPGGEARFQAGQLAAEEERLKELMRGLELQHGHRVAQREELTIRSPLAGQVLTWEVDRLLRARPLRPGQRLMTIAQVDGPWVLELRLADADVGHVMAARHEASAPLPVSFRATNNPSRAQRARVTSIAEWTDSQDSAGPSLQATATLDEPVAAGSHPGTSVVARIHLGQRARGFVWFRDLWEFVRLRLWF